MAEARRGARWLVAALIAVCTPVLAGCRVEIGGGPYDGCGNDLSGYESFVIAVDAATGREEWRTHVPSHGAYLALEPDGMVRVDTVSAHDDTIIDPITGEAVDHRAPAGYRVVIDATGTSIPFGSLEVNGEVQHLTVAVGDLEISSDVMVTESDLHLHAGDVGGGQQVWSTVIAEEGSWRGGVTRPIVVGDDVLIAVGLDRRPNCY